MKHILKVFLTGAFLLSSSLLKANDVMSWVPPYVSGTNWVEYFLIQEGRVQLTITAINGQSILSKHLQKGDEVNLSFLKTGVFVVVAVSESSFQTIKFVSN